MLSGKSGLVVGVTNHRSLGWRIAREFRKHGASMTITFQHEKQANSIEKLLRDETASNEASLPPLRALQCDVSRGEDLLRLRSTLQEGRPLDIVCHSVAFAQPVAMRHGLLGLSELESGGSLRELEALRTAWSQAFDVSVFSLVALARELRPLLRRPSSLMTLSYLGADRAIPGYSVMGPAKAALQAVVRGLAQELGPAGARVNAISAGPVDTVSARGISGFRDLRNRSEKAAPLGAHPSPEEIARVAAFLASEQSAGMTGQTIFVDAGLSASQSFDNFQRDD